MWWIRNRWWSVLVVLVHVSPVLGAEITGGPMVGYAAHQVGRLWLQTDGPATIRVYVAPADRVDDESAWFLAGEGATTARESYAIHLTLRWLEADRTYAYRVEVDGRLVERPYPMRLHTLPRERHGEPRLRVAFGSCLYANTDEYDQPGRHYGGDFQILEHIAAARPEIMLWLGDNVYLRDVDMSAVEAMDRRYARTRALAEMQPLLAVAHNYATWDDHDYGVSDASWSFPLKAATTKLFRRYWDNPSYGLPELPGVFTRFRWGDVEFFLLDNRTYRDHVGLRGRSKAMLGAEQLRWLIDALVSSEAVFKIVVAGGQMLNPLAVYETYARFPEERRALLEALVAQRVSGVFFLSGDRHHGELVRVEPEGFYPLYDATSSPLTAGPSTVSGEEKNPARVAGTLAVTRNYGLLDFVGRGAERALRVSLHDAAGALLWTKTIRAAELVPPSE